MNSFTISFFMRLLALLKDFLRNPDGSVRNTLYLTALSCLGTDVTPNDIVPDEYGCAETVNAIYKKAFGVQIGGGPSTYLLYLVLCKHPKFIPIDIPDKGDIIISPSGFGNGNLPSGHVGIVSIDKKIMSNDSSTGIFKENYTLDSWKEKYVALGGYPMKFFRRI